MHADKLYKLNICINVFTYMFKTGDRFKTRSTTTHTFFSPFKLQFEH